MTPGTLPIPKTIHYCWYGNTPVSELGRHCIETWRTVMPDYSIDAWDERRLPATSPYASIAYRQKKYAFVADYMRLLVLYQEGGLYLDTDVEVVRRFDELLDQPLFMGLQSPESIGVSVIGATKGHPFLKAVLDELDREGRSGKPVFQPLPELVTSMAEGATIDGLTVFPEDYFYPYNPYSPVPVRRKPLQANMSAQTFCVHHWEGTWLGGMSLRMMIGLRAKNMLRKVSAGLHLPARGNVTRRANTTRDSGKH